MRRKLLGSWLAGLLLAACAAPSPGAPSADFDQVVWVLEELDGQPVQPGERQAPKFVAHSADGRVSGFTGCNRFTGKLTRDGNQLKLGPLASTRMACADTGDLERRFVEVLNTADAFRIQGPQLELLRAGKALARFKQGPKIVQ